MKCTTIDKKEINRKWMEIYREEKMTDEQKAKVKEYDRKHAAQICLEKKIDQITKKSSAAEHK